LTTVDVPPLEGTIGQPRAVDAIAFGLEISSPGYNLYVAGPAVSGRERTVHDFLRRFALTRPSPSDWVYVYNFVQSDQPKAIRLPQGRGRTFAADLDGFLQAAQRDIPHAFESEDYERHRREALSELTQRRDALFTELETFARDKGFAIETTPTGIVTVPLRQGQPLTDEEFKHLSAQQQQELEQHSKELQERITDMLRQVRHMQKEGSERVRQLNRDVALYTVGPHLDDLRETYRDQPEVLAYLD
jgi:AAA domain